MKNRDKKQNSKILINGSYSVLITVLLLAGLLIVNLIINRLPVNVTQFDFSNAKLYTLTDTTTELLKNLDQDVDLYYICEGGDEDDTIQKLLDRYEAASSHIRVEQVDPALYPGFTSQYTEEDVPNNSVIAVSGDVSKVVSADSMYVESLNYSTYSYVKTGFDGEGMITSAVDYVTAEDIPNLYILMGNGEATLGSAFGDVITKDNVNPLTLNLLTADKVPDDADAILINTPTVDYTEEEVEKILDYLEAGGKAIIYSNYTVEEMPNFDSILANYGMERVDGIVLEGDSDKFMSYQYCIVPEVSYSAITENVYGSGYVLAPMSQGIVTTDSHRDSITYQPLLTTSDASYNKEDVENMTTSEKEKGDESGPFTVGMLIQEDIDNDGEADTEIIYYSSGYLLESNYNQAVSGNNAKLLGGTVNYLCNGEEATSAVQTKSLQVEYLTLTDRAANIWTVICVFTVPILFIIAGLAVWASRRKR